MKQTDHAPTSILTERQKKSLASFESFLSKVGFKRIDGAIYGLLVLSPLALSQEQIESELGLSQSAISQSLKTLGHYGAIEITVPAQTTSKRIKYYSAREDSLGTVATIFRKREQEAISEFKYLASDLLKEVASEESVVSRRLKSIIETCEIAEVVMDFVLKLSSHQAFSEYGRIIKKLPGALDLIAKTTGPTTRLAAELGSNLTGKLLKGIEVGLSKYNDNKEGHS